MGASLHIWHPRKIPQQGTLLHRGHPVPGVPCTAAPSAFPTHALPGSEHQAAAWGPWDIRRGEDLFRTESFMQRRFCFVRGDSSAGWPAAGRRSRSQGYAKRDSSTQLLYAGAAGGGALSSFIKDT